MVELVLTDKQAEEITGIYCYKDVKTNEIVYVGKDSHINEDRRHRQHLTPSGYDRQPFNRILQNNPTRYEYNVLKKGNFDNKWLSFLEIIFIKRYSPKFNFTVGGDGSKGYVHSEESKLKMSESHKGEKNHFYGRHHTEESKQKMREAVSGEKSYWYGRKRTNENKIKVSKSSNTTGYFRVCKVKKPKCKQGFMWEYKYYDEDKKRHTLSSVDINKLKEKVLAIGEIWYEFGGGQ